MRPDYLNSVFQQINTLQLLRERNALLILSFLKAAFPEGRKYVTQEELTMLLSEHLQQFDAKEVFDESESDGTDLFSRYRDKAKSLLRDWESVKKRYLRGGNNADGQYEYSITEHVVRAWQWLESLENREFTGTQSRLADIFEKIRRVLENSREKTDAERIAELRQKQQDIEADIVAIQTGKNPYRPFDNMRLREEYEGLLEQIRALATDFKTVEGNFERIRTDMLRHYAMQEGNKGALLSAALDARDELDRTPQGQSFNSFFEALRDPHRTQVFEAGVKAFLAILTERQIDYTNDQRLTRLYRHLLGEAQPVLEANRRIADRITRLVAENTTHNRQLLRQRLAEVKTLLLHPEFAKAAIDSDQPFWELNSDEAEIYLPLEKSLRTQPATQGQSYQLPQKAEETKPEIPFFDEVSIAIRLEQHIAAVLEQRNEQTLAVLTEQFPIQEGLVEILAYLNIVARPDNRHFINTDTEDLIELNAALRQFIEGPGVYFIKA